MVSPQFWNKVNPRRLQSFQGDGHSSPLVEATAALGHESVARLYACHLHAFNIVLYISFRFSL